MKFYDNDIYNECLFILTNLCNYHANFWIQHKNSLDKIIEYFGDDFSKLSYKNEIMHKILWPIIGQNCNSYIDGISSKDFNLAKDKFLNDQFRKKYGEFFDDIRMYCFACTFYYEQYKYDDIICVDNNDIFFDIGACFGDTAYWASKNGAKSVYSFEIDKKNINIFKNEFMQDNIFLIEKAIGASACRMNFSSSEINPGGGKINEKNKTGIEVDVITIDDFCIANHIAPSFIKMDIEGSEMKALVGGENTIRQYKPKLAIALYHKREDMFEIPLFLKKLVPEYKFYCKKSHPKLEFVLFAKA